MWGGVGEQNVWCCENVEMIQDRLECGACGVKNNSTSGLWAECGACGALQYDLAIHNIATSKVETGIQQKNYV